MTRISLGLAHALDADTQRKKTLRRGQGSVKKTYSSQEKTLRERTISLAVGEIGAVKPPGDRQEETGDHGTEEKPNWKKKDNTRGGVIDQSRQTQQIPKTQPG